MEPLLPPQKPRTGRPSKDHRTTIVNAILWLDRTGAPWRDLPSEYGPWRSVATRFYRWVKAGVWDRVLGELQRQADAAQGELDWQLHNVDGSVVLRAHQQHAAGAKKGGASATATTTRRRQGREKKIRRLSDAAGADSHDQDPPTSVPKAEKESPWPS